MKELVQNERLLLKKILQEALDATEPTIRYQRVQEYLLMLGATEKRQECFSLEDAEDTRGEMEKNPIA